MISNNRNHWEKIDQGGIKASNTPQELWNTAREYFKWCDSNPIIIPRLVTNGKEAGRSFDEKKIRPYNVKALCLHCGISEEYLNDILRNGGGEWLFVVKNMLMCIWTQLFEMGALGEFSPIFTAKALNMDKEDAGPQKVTIEYIGDLPQLSSSENEVLEKLKLERGEIKLKTD